MTITTLAGVPSKGLTVNRQSSIDDVASVMNSLSDDDGVLVVEESRVKCVLTKSLWTVMTGQRSSQIDAHLTLGTLLSDHRLPIPFVLEDSTSLLSAIRRCHAAGATDWLVVHGKSQTPRPVHFRDVLGSFLATLERTDHTLAAANDQQASSSQQAFVANMSHELRTPLTSILGYAENIVDDVNASQESREDAQTIVRNGEYLLNLLNDVLDYAKYQAGKLTIENIPFPLPRLLGEIMSSMKIKADAKKLELRLTQKGALPESVISDPTRIRQILINLIGNAIKFTDQGSVILHVQCQENDDEPRRSRLHFSVEDTGIGLKHDQMHKLFAPFSQADQSTTRNFGGTGLGLTICRRLTKMLGGEMKVKSAFGKGSIFTSVVQVEVPEESRFIDDIASLRPPAKLDAFDYSQAQLPCRVYLAEDSPDNQVLITRFLERCGMDVTLGENGQVAFEAISRAEEGGEPFDIVLMDMQMPIVGGYEATTRLRQRAIQTPIIAMTASVLERDKQRCLDCGCNALAPKPYDRRQLLELIRTHLPDHKQHAGSHQRDDVLDVAESRAEPSAAERPQQTGLNRSPFLELISGQSADAETEESSSSGFSSSFATGMFPAPQFVLVDKTVALQRTGHDVELLNTIVDLILEHCPKYLEDLTSAVANKDAKTTKRLAHTIKGSAENVGGKRVRDVCMQLEKSAAEEYWPQIVTEFEELKSLITPFLNSVRQLKTPDS